MKLWQAILLTIAIIAIFIFFIPKELVRPIGNVLWLCSGAWVYFDAKKINPKKYQSNLGVDPAILAGLVILVWPIAFPGYLWLKYRIKHNLVPIRDKYKTQAS